MLEKIEKSMEYVRDNSEIVKINYDKVLTFAKEYQKTSFWLSSNPFGLLDLGYPNVINLIFIFHTIGFSFWGNPKWEIETDNGKTLDGSYALLYLITKRIKEKKPFVMTFDEFKEFLGGKNEIPFLKERYKMLVLMNKKVSKKTFYEQIKNIYDDETLFQYIIKNYPYFEDIRTYKGQKVYFYKRAQLIVSDVLHIRELLEKVKVDYSHLVGCADYKIPQVMNSLGMLNYPKYLDEMLENMEEIPLNSKEEIEIRANTLAVIDYINKNTKNTTKMEINDFIWSLSQNKEKITKNYHRTRTTDY